MRPLPLEGTWRGEVSVPWEAPSLAKQSAGSEKGNSEAQPDFLIDS